MKLSSPFTVNCRTALQPLGLFLLLSASTQALAHEYWLDPVGKQWTTGDELQADVRNGQEFIGSALPFQPEAFSRAGLISDNDRRAISGRLGDYPAFQIPLTESGLHLLLLETTQRELIYENYADFETFLDYHGFQTIGELHRDRGLPRENIIEHYYRYCKALVFVDDAKPASGTASNTAARTSDSSAPALAAQDQRLELLALNDPLQSQVLSLQLLSEGEPLPKRQVELFYRDANNATVRRVADTDEQGLVEFATAQAGDYLVNSVRIVEPDDQSAHWMTLWASLYFQKN